MAESKTNTLVLTLMGVVIVLMVAIAGLFIRVTELQREVLGSLTLLRAERVEEKGVAIGSQAPFFSLPDSKGGMVSLQQFGGQKLLLIFSSTQCPACKATYPHIKAFAENRRDVQVLIVSYGSAEENRQVKHEQDFSFPVLIWDEGVAQNYQVPGTPFFYVIDGKGTIVGSGFANTLEQIEAMITRGNQ